MLALFILGIVLLLIAVRQIGNFRLQIWQIMLGGAIAALLFGAITPTEALDAIHFDVIVFLFCMFVIGQALEESGYLAHLTFRFFRNARSTDALVLFVLFGIGMLSAVLMNDTLAIVGTPIVLLLAHRHRVSPKLMLLALAFAVTIGSVLSPIGNPQNLLIAFHVQNPFIEFLKRLLFPTVLSLLATYVILKIFYAKEFHNDVLVHTPETVKDERLAFLCKISLWLLLLLIAAKIALVFFGVDFRITYIAVLSALPVLLSGRFGVIRRIDWYTLIFFAAMFVLMEAVWMSGSVQSLLSAIDLTNVLIILLVGVLASQLISNVPLVALLLPALAAAAPRELVALAAGSTLAGNLFILGAASNVIIIQTAERQGETLTFWEFARVGIPVTVVTVVIYWVFL